MGEGLQWFFSTIADPPGGRSAMGEGLQYNIPSNIEIFGTLFKNISI